MTAFLLAFAAACSRAPDPPGGPTAGTTPAPVPAPAPAPVPAPEPAPGVPGPEIEAVEPALLPAPTAYGLPPVHGFTVNARIHPHGRPAAWRVEYGPTEAYGEVSADRQLPGRLAAYYAESWDGGANGWQAGMSGQQLSWHPAGGPDGGPFVRYTDDQGAGDDTNHYEGIGAIHLGPYAYLGNYTGAGILPAYLGGGFPDLRGATFRASLRGVGWDPHGTELGTWIQGARDQTVVDLVPEDLRFPNWAHTGELQTSHLASGAWEAASWTLRNRSADWTFAGTYGGRLTYDYGELDPLLGSVNVDLFALQILYVDIFDQPSGSWDLADLEITYRQHSALAPSNGGTLVASPAGGSGADLLVDGWRNGPGREWQSGPDPVDPQVFEYTFARPITLTTLNVHNAATNPSRDVRVEASSDGGATWIPVIEGELPEAHPLGPNYVFLHADTYVLIDGIAVWAPLVADPVDRLRVTVHSGWQAAGWGLGEIEAFGPGAIEETDDAWYDVTQDILVGVPSTLHYRVIAETDAGTTVGPDQVVEIP